MAIKRAASTDSTNRTIYLTGTDDQWIDRMSVRWSESRSGVIKRLIYYYRQTNRPEPVVTRLAKP